MDERNRKRKLEELEAEGSDFEGVEKELPQQGLKKAQEKKVKKQKTETDSEPSKPITPSKESKDFKPADSEARRLKAERKQQKKSEKVEKKKTKKVHAAEQVVKLPAAEDEEDVVVAGDAEEPELADEEVGGDNEIGHFEADGLEESELKDSTKSPSPAPSPIFDNPTDPSTNTSENSVVPPATAPKHIKLPSDPELLRARLAARIDALRAARKADGPDGAPARNRQELMEARRKKELDRKENKKAIRLKAKIEEDARREAALLSARNSPASMMSPSVHSADHNFSFGRVAFADGQQLSDNLTSLVAAPRKKGPQDPATALEASEKRRKRVAGFDEEKRADIEEKDLWLNAKKRAHGEKVRDDSSLLKKTLKRKEKAKKKSTKEWGDRMDSQNKGTAMKQKKREENLKARRDGANKGKGKGKPAAKSKGKPKVKSRPGFEGSFGGGKRK